MAILKYSAALASVLSFMVILAFVVWGCRGIRSLEESSTSPQVLLAYAGVGTLLGLLTLTALAWIYVTFRSPIRR